MILVRQKPGGGRKLGYDSFPIDEDEKTGRMGFKFGYWENGESLIIPFEEARIIANGLGDQLTDLFGRRKQKTPFNLRKWLIQLLGGTGGSE